MSALLHRLRKRWYSEARWTDYCIRRYEREMRGIKGDRLAMRDLADLHASVNAISRLGRRGSARGADPSTEPVVARARAAYLVRTGRSTRSYEDLRLSGMSDAEIASLWGEPKHG